MKRQKTRVRLFVVVIALIALIGIPDLSKAGLIEDQGESVEETQATAVTAGNLDGRFKKGRDSFRFATFGDQAFWGDTLRLHDAIKGATFGGVGPGLSPNAALGLGLKVAVDALPEFLVQQLRANLVDLNDPAVTLDLLRLDAVIGVTGFFDLENKLVSVGIQCALCHTVVDDSLVPGIGHRLDGWANRDLNVGAIIALSPNVQPFVDLLRIVAPNINAAGVRAILNSWGPGKFDAELLLDGKAFRSDGKSAATLIPPIFGLAGVNLHTWTGWGAVTHWNAFVANVLMGGKGTFFDPRLNNADRFPIAAAAGLGDVRNTPDLITLKMANLHFYQLTLRPPKPPAGSFDPIAAALGAQLFMGKAKCATCHVPPLYTEPGWNMHTAAELGVDAFQAIRAPDRRYRTSPLKGLWSHTKGGFFHDGRFATLTDVIAHLNVTLNLGLTEQETQNLIQFLLSI